MLSSEHEQKTPTKRWNLKPQWTQRLSTVLLSIASVACSLTLIIFITFYHFGSSCFPFSMLEIIGISLFFPWRFKTPANPTNQAAPEKLKKVLDSWEELRRQCFLGWKARVCRKRDEADWTFRRPILWYSYIFLIYIYIYISYIFQLFQSLRTSEELALDKSLYTCGSPVSVVSVLRRLPGSGRPCGWDRLLNALGSIRILNETVGIGKWLLHWILNMVF